MDGITERSKRKRFIILTNYNMTKVKSKCCSKEEAKKDLEKRLWDNEFVVTFHIWEDNKVGIELEPRWKEEKAIDCFIDRFRFWCISSLLEIWKELLWDDVKTTAQVIKDFLDQLHYNAKNEFWMDEKEETIDEFKKLFRKSVKEDSDED